MSPEFSMWIIKRGDHRPLAWNWNWSYQYEPIIWQMGIETNIHIYMKSVQFSCSVMSDSLRPHEPQHTRPPCPSPTPGVHPDSYPLSRWCHPTISSSVIPFSSCFQSYQHQGLFQWVNSLHQVVKVSEFQLQHQSFQWTCKTDLL